LEMEINACLQWFIVFVSFFFFVSTMFGIDNVVC
jgi:hypothetical protein